MGNSSFSIERAASSAAAAAWRVAVLSLGRFCSAAASWWSALVFSPWLSCLTAAGAAKPEDANRLRRGSRSPANAHAISSTAASCLASHAATMA